MTDNSKPPNYFRINQALRARRPRRARIPSRVRVGDFTRERACIYISVQDVDDNKRDFLKRVVIWLFDNGQISHLPQCYLNQLIFRSRHENFMEIFNLYLNARRAGVDLDNGTCSELIKDKHFEQLCDVFKHLTQLGLKLKKKEYFNLVSQYNGQYFSMIFDQIFPYWTKPADRKILIKSLLSLCEEPSVLYRRIEALGKSATRAAVANKLEEFCPGLCFEEPRAGARSKALPNADNENLVNQKAEDGSASHSALPRP